MCDFETGTCEVLLTSKDATTEHLAMYCDCMCDYVTTPCEVCMTNNMPPLNTPCIALHNCMCEIEATTTYELFLTNKFATSERLALYCTTA
jgi:hypothetical protein